MIVARWGSLALAFVAVAACAYAAWLESGWLFGTLLAAAIVCFCVSVWFKERIDEREMFRDLVFKARAGALLRDGLPSDIAAGLLAHSKTPASDESELPYVSLELVHEFLADPTEGEFQETVEVMVAHELVEVRQADGWLRLTPFGEMVADGVSKRSRRRR